MPGSRTVQDRRQAAAERRRRHQRATRRGGGARSAAANPSESRAVARAGTPAFLGGFGVWVDGWGSLMRVSQI